MSKNTLKFSLHFFSDRSDFTGLPQEGGAGWAGLQGACEEAGWLFLDLSDCGDPQECISESIFFLFLVYSCFLHVFYLFHVFSTFRDGACWQHPMSILDMFNLFLVVFKNDKKVAHTIHFRQENRKKIRFPTRNRKKIHFRHRRGDKKTDIACQKNRKN